MSRSEEVSHKPPFLIELNHALSAGEAVDSARRRLAGGAGRSARPGVKPPAVLRQDRRDGRATRAPAQPVQPDGGERGSFRREGRRSRIVVRLYEAEGRDTETVTLTAAVEIQSMIETDLIEKPGASAARGGGRSLTFSLGAFEIKTSVSCWSHGKGAERSIRSLHAGAGARTGVRQEPAKRVANEALS